MFSLKPPRTTVVTDREQLGRALLQSDRVIVEGNPDLLNYALGYVERDARDRADLSFETRVAVEPIAIDGDASSHTQERRSVAEPAAGPRRAGRRNPVMVALMALCLSCLLGWALIQAGAPGSMTTKGGASISDTGVEISAVESQTERMMGEQARQAAERDSAAQQRANSREQPSDRVQAQAEAAEELRAKTERLLREAAGLRSAAAPDLALEVDLAKGSPAPDGGEGSRPPPRLSPVSKAEHATKPHDLAASAPLDEDVPPQTARPDPPPPPPTRPAPTQTTVDIAAIAQTVAWPVVALVAILALLMVASRAIKANRDLEISWKVTEKVTGRVVITKVKTPTPRKKAA